MSNKKQTCAIYFRSIVQFSLVNKNRKLNETCVQVSAGKPSAATRNVFKYLNFNGYIENEKRKMKMNCYIAD